MVIAPEFGHKHYVPILKSKAGERWALSHLDAARRAHLTPLLELHPHRDKPISIQVAAVCEDLAADWGTDDSFFLDTIWLAGAAGNPAIIADAFESAIENDLQAIPVVRTSYDAPSLAQVRAIIEDDEDDVGCMLRITRNDLAPGVIARIDQTIAALELTPAQVDLLLDYGTSHMQLAADFGVLPHLQNWRTLTAAAGTFPRSLINLAPNAWHALQRREWIEWLAQLGAGIARRPAFSDYATRDPGAPASFGAPIVNVRYTTSTTWSVRVGGKFKDGAAPEMKTGCAELIQRPDFSGAGYSAGDGEFHATAQPGPKTGNPGQWVQWSVNHHLVYVVDQIQNHPAL